MAHIVSGGFAVANPAHNLAAGFAVFEETVDGGSFRDATISGKDFSSIR